MLYRCLGIEKQCLVNSRIHAQALDRLQVILIAVPLNIGESSVLGHRCGGYFEIYRSENACLIAKDTTGQGDGGGDTLNTDALGSEAE